MPLVKLNSDQLAIGHYVCLPIGWTSHPFMFNNFKIKTNEELLVLNSLKLDGIDVDISKSDSSALKSKSKDTTNTHRATQTAAVDPVELLQTKHRTMQRRAERHYSAQMSAFKNALSKFNSNPEEVFFHISEAVNNTSNWLNELATEQPLYLVFSDNNGDDLFNHSLNVVVLSLQVANTLGLDPKKCRLLGLTAMCLDIGFLKVPTQIRRSTTPLTGAEQSYYEMHATYSVDILKKAGSFPPEIYPLIANHHERLDGSGYPHNLKADKFDTLGKLLQLVDQYICLTCPPPWKKQTSPQTAIALLYKSAGVKYDKTILEAMVKVLGIYPPGSIVELSDGQLALVSATNPKNKLKPYVKIFNGRKPIVEQPFENLDTLSLSISKSVSLDKAPDFITIQMSQLRLGYFFSTSE